MSKVPVPEVPRERLQSAPEKSAEAVSERTHQKCNDLVTQVLEQLPQDMREKIVATALPKGVTPTEIARAALTNDPEGRNAPAVALTTLAVDYKTLA